MRLVDCQTFTITQFGVKAFLNDIRGKFELAQSDEVLCYLFEDFFILLLVFQLNHILNEVVAVWILDQIVNVVDDVVRKIKFLTTRTLFQTALHNATSVFVLPNGNTIVDASLENEVCILTCLKTAKIVLVLWSLGGFEHHQKGLDYMVAVHVNSQINHLDTEACNNYSEDFVESLMSLVEFKSLHFIEWNAFVFGPFDVLPLAVDS